MRLLHLLAAGFIALTACGGGSDDPEVKIDINLGKDNIIATWEKSVHTIEVTCSGEWSVYTNDSWIKCEKARDAKTITVTLSENLSEDSREGRATVKSGTVLAHVKVTQQGKPAEQADPSIQVPDGYKLVWHDEFDEDGLPGSDWWYETGAGGWGNNEIQNYVKGETPDGTRLASVMDGIFTIKCAKVGGTVYSIRINTQKSWTYGYFEARLKLPTGKGTWPAFWMMPKNFTNWPGDGEIDIMEEVGYNPDRVSSSIHCNAYNHSIGTQKTREILVSGAQKDFHVYALEWSKDYIRTFVDGKELFRFDNDGRSNYDTWPFYTPFYLKLNLAWGGNWGGAQGVDESCLPAEYQIDYVRVFQKK